MKKKSTILPIALLIYLGIFVYLGWPGYKTGQTSGLTYFGVTAFTILVIILLHFNLKKRERLRRERLDDIARTEAQKDNENDAPKN